MAQGRGRRSIEEAIIFVAARSRGRALEHARARSRSESKVGERVDPRKPTTHGTVTVGSDVSFVVLVGDHGGSDVSTQERKKERKKERVTDR